MNNLDDWKDYYMSKGIKVDFYNSHAHQRVGIHGLIGDNNLRAIYFGNLKDKSFYFRKSLLERVLSLLYLSDNYPWVIYTSDTLSILFRCSSSEKEHNSNHLLWHTKVALPSIKPNVFFYHSELPDVCPYSVDYNLVKSSLKTIEEELLVLSDESLKEYEIQSTNYAPYIVVKKKGLKNFLREYNQVRFGHEYYSITEDIQSVCFFKRRDGKILTVYNLNNYTLEDIKSNCEILQVELRESGHYILCGRSDFNNDDGGRKAASYWEAYDNADYERYEQDWSDYYKMRDEESNLEAEQKRLEEEKRAASKRSDEFLYDFSGDDLSLDPSMW